MKTFFQAIEKWIFLNPKNSKIYISNLNQNKINLHQYRCKTQQIQILKI